MTFWEIAKTLKLPLSGSKDRENVWFSWGCLLQTILKKRVWNDAWILENPKKAWFYQKNENLCWLSTLFLRIVCNDEPPRETSLQHAASRREVGFWRFFGKEKHAWNLRFGAHTPKFRKFDRYQRFLPMQRAPKMSSKSPRKTKVSSVQYIVSAGGVWVTK